jgi:hypothetical protein
MIDAMMSQSDIIPFATHACTQQGIVEAALFATRLTYSGHREGRSKVTRRHRRCRALLMRILCCACVSGTSKSGSAKLPKGIFASAASL